MDAHGFQLCHGQSIDYAVIENTSDAVVPSDAGWNGSAQKSPWDSGEEDQAGDVVVVDTLLYDTKSSYVRAKGQQIFAIV